MKELTKKLVEIEIRNTKHHLAAVKVGIENLDALTKDYDILTDIMSKLDDLHIDSVRQVNELEFYIQ